MLSASAVDQSIFEPFLTFSAFLEFNILTIVLCKFTFSGIVFIFSEISKSFFVSAPVIPLLSFPFSGL